MRRRLLGVGGSLAVRRHVSTSSLWSGDRTFRRFPVADGSISPLAGARCTTTISSSSAASPSPSTPSESTDLDALVLTVGQTVQELLRSSKAASAPVSDVYARLPSELRRQLRAVKLSLSGCLARYLASDGPHEIELQDSGLTVSLLRRSSASAATSSQTASRSPVVEVVSEPHKVLYNAPASKPAPPTSGTVRIHQPVDFNKKLYGDEFCFQVKLTEIPEPPRQIAGAPLQAAAAAGGNNDGTTTDDSNVFNVAALVPIIPTYFVPVEEVLAHLPGYTNEHIQQYVSCCKTVQVVTLHGEGQFIRLHGGYAQLDLTGTEEAEALFPQYEPKEELAAPFIAAFEDIRDRWMPLQTLLERAGEDAVRRLPFQGRQALLYFAQLQHLFSFAPDDGGAVLLRPPFYTGLDVPGSPTPKAVSLTLGLLPMHEQVDFKRFVELLPDEAKLDIAKKFPSVEHYLRSHGVLFYLSDDNLVVMRARHRKLLVLRTLPLEEQLEIAIRERDKKRIRVLRRKIVTHANADNPLFNPENLAKEVYNYIPRKGHIPVKQLFKRVLPPELLDFMPNSFGKFFKNFPHYFQIFEFGSSTNWVVSRAGTPLPSGAIRRDFTEDDCVSILAELLQARGAKSVSFVSLHLPEGVRECVKKSHGSIVTFALRHKEYFSIINTIDSGRNKESACLINLIKMPLRREDTAVTDEDDEDGDDEPGKGS